MSNHIHCFWCWQKLAHVLDWIYKLNHCFWQAEKKQAYKPICYGLWIKSSTWITNWHNVRFWIICQLTNQLPASKMSNERTSQVIVKLCCYGTCNTDSRYLDRVENRIEFIPFPSINLQNLMRGGIRLCRRSREQLNENIFRNDSGANHFFILFAPK